MCLALKPFLWRVKIKNGWKLNHTNLIFNAYVLHIIHNSTFIEINYETKNKIFSFYANNGICYSLIWCTRFIEMREKSSDKIWLLPSMSRAFVKILHLYNILIKIYIFYAITPVINSVNNFIQQITNIN